MAVFLVNNCTYPDCRKKFSNLSDLIYHIEEEHIDFSPAAVEEKERQKVQYISLSYVLNYSQLYSRRPETIDNSVFLKKASIAPKIETEYILPEHDTVIIESEISDDSWNDECTNNDFINYSRKSVDSNYASKEYTSRAKKFLCPVPGCNKRYKNINGIKYHTKNTHEINRNPIKPKKIHKCYCGKSYKTIQGLKAHSITHREININFHKMNAGASASYLSTSQKFGHLSYPYIHQSDLLNNNFINKPDIADEDMLPYSYLEQRPKLNETSEYDQNSGGHFGFFTPPYSCGSSVSNEGFPDNLMLEESINQNYQLSLAYRKY